MLYAYCEATVPKITVVTRKAYGGAYIAMCCRQLGADMVMAWPSAEIAVMGPDGAVNIIFKNDPDKEKRKQEYIDEFLSPYKAAEHGQIDCIIEPKERGRASSAPWRCFTANVKNGRPRNTAICRCKEVAVC